MSLCYKFEAKTLIKEGRVSQNDVEEIKIWLQTTSIPQLHDELIALFLLSCQNDVASTQATIKQHFKIKGDAPEFFTERNVDSEVLKKAMNVIVCCSIPKRMSDNTVIHFFKLTDTNYKNFDLVASMKLSLMLLDVSQRYNPPNQLIVVIDMKGSTFMHLTCLKIMAVKKFIDFMQEAMPLRIHKIHILNANYIFDKALAIAKVFMNAELLSQIIPHSPKMTMEEFHRDCIPAAYLPAEYGGNLPSCDELNQRTVEQFGGLELLLCGSVSLDSAGWR
ncbi:retinaldehyde-binding protein 1-like isoform X2 [Zophobas morio]|uniref:retinaldehyde-binding protein 1-like isoform X2 n=1 Tax=Zophobas morio TaxID=2755281 RepID=UPI0030828BA1